MDTFHIAKMQVPDFWPASSPPRVGRASQPDMPFATLLL